MVPFTGINADSKTSYGNVIGAFAGRGVKRGLSQFPQVTMKEGLEEGICGNSQYDCLLDLVL